jgi:hypothetical protein
MKTGLARQKKAAFSSGLGGFLFLNQISSDSSIVPQDEFQGYNEEIMIVDLQAIGAGVHASLNATIPFMKHFIASFSLRPGIGLVYKNVETESISYHPNNPLMYQFILGSLLGYNGKTYYINISMSYAYYKTSLDFGNSINYNTTIAKLALGFKLGQNRIFKNKND